MELNIQYNKTALHALEKAYKIRLRILPTLKKKEAALRAEIIRARRQARQCEAQEKALLEGLGEHWRLWAEWEPGKVFLIERPPDTRMIAGIEIPLPGQVTLSHEDRSPWGQPLWIWEGLQLLRQLAELKVHRQVYLRQMAILSGELKKTSQKVNLYEKVQLPAFEQGIRKIKRFIENEENIARAAQKIVKKRL